MNFVIKHVARTINFANCRRDMKTKKLVGNFVAVTDLRKIGLVFFFLIFQLNQSGRM